MARPLTRAQLIAAAEKEYAALEKVIAPLTPEQMTRPLAAGEWSIKDVLAHLHEWQQMFFRWFAAGLRGERPAVPADGYKWSQLPALNRCIYETYRDLPLAEVRRLYRESHRRTMDLIATLSDEDLLTPGRWPWMNRNTLLAYLNANTGAHYRWARGEVKARIKA